MKRLITMVMVLGLQSGFAFAEEKAPKWEVLPEESHITFTATQNSAPVKGSFKEFTAEIYFDPEHLDKSSVKAEIATGSVGADYEEVSDTLKGKDWFDIEAFPKAIFESVSFKHIQDNQYEADGMLMIHGKGAPVVLPFTLEIADKDGVQVADMHGKTTLKRTVFGVGQGEWQDTKTVQDDVVVEVALKAKKAQ